MTPYQHGRKFLTPLVRSSIRCKILTATTSTWRVITGITDGYHIGTAQVPDFVGTVIDTVQDPDGHHIDMESDNRNHRRLPHRYGASS